MPKVQFTLEPTVFLLNEWGSTSREARRGAMWEEMARHRARFQRRIESLRPILELILLAEHRKSRHVSETSSFPKNRSDQHSARLKERTTE